MEIRREGVEDHGEIRALVAAAFGSPVQAALVDAIRESDAFVPEWSLVAVVDERLVGHVMVSWAVLHDGSSTRRIANLSPLSVAPERQRRGIGAALVRALVAVVDAAGEPVIVLEGDPAYYSRFGFEHSLPLGIRIPLPEWASPEAAQVLRLGSCDPSVRGDVEYPPEFRDLAH